MDGTDALNACTVVNTWPYEELKRILYEYGEERYAPQIASNAFKGVTASAFYPSNSQGWNRKTAGQYGGTLTFTEARVQPEGELEFL